jgi:hypothetical protein
MAVVSKNQRQAVLARELELQNYSGRRFKMKVLREIGVIPAESLNEEIGVKLFEGIDYLGSYSLNTLTNLDETAWEKEHGLPCLWILGQFNASPKAFIMAPTRPLDDLRQSGTPPFNDNYFGRVSVESPERLKMLGNTVLFRADAGREGKFGLSPQRTLGLAGSYDPGKGLLIIVKFDYHPDGELYADFTWEMDPMAPYQGDVFQAYNALSAASRDLNAFYELESVSPCAELKPGESLQHRHATYCFAGDLQRLNPIARDLLGVDLKECMDRLGIPP